MSLMETNSVQIPPSSTWSEFGTIAVKFKCKLCTFETEELSTLKCHHGQAHSATAVTTSSGLDVSTGKQQKQTSATEPVIMNSKTSQQKKQIIPPHKVEAGMIQTPSSEIYLCSECNVTFESETSCFGHMSSQHGLDEFDENLTSSGRLETKPASFTHPFPRPKRKSRPPRMLTLEEGGVVVPKKFRKDSKTKCILCKAKFEQEEILQIHQQCHNRKVVNIYERDIIDSQEDQDQHPKKVLGYTCILCKIVNRETKKGKNDAVEGIKFAKWGQCAIHLWRKHNIDCELHQCPKCPFKAYAKTTLTEHANIHGIVSKFKCQTCHKAFKQLSQLKNHEKYHKEKSTKLPPPGEERWYTPKICPVCGRVLSDQKCLKRHISYVHNKLKQHVCNICGHMSARKAELQLHMRQHTGERPHKCPFCTFTTTYPCSLRRHKCRHTLDYAYGCAYCDYKCIQSNAFKLHMKTNHPDERGIYRCSNCSFESVNSTLLEAHLKGHIDADEGRNESPVESDSNRNSICLHDTDSRSHESHEDGEDDEMSERSRRRISVRTKSWLQEDDSDDEDSSRQSLVVPMQDTIGGVTIPAPSSD